MTAKAGTWWNESYEYKKTITITNATANYQMRLNVTYTANMQSDFDDIRFIDGTTILPYWIEKKVDTTYALVWVKLNDSGNTIEMYYGNNTAVSMSNATESWDYSIIWTSDLTAGFTHSTAASNRRHSFNINTTIPFRKSDGYRIMMNTAVVTTLSSTDFDVGAGFAIGNPVNKVFGNSLYGGASYYGTNYFLAYNSLNKNSNYTFDIFATLNSSITNSRQYVLNLYTVNEWNVHQMLINNTVAVHQINHLTSDGTVMATLSHSTDLPTVPLYSFGYYSNCCDYSGYKHFWGYNSTNKAVQWGGYASGRNTLVFQSKWTMIGKYQSNEPTASIPSSSVDAISPYFQKSGCTITATATDPAGNDTVKNVSLWYRYSSDNASWGGYVNYGLDVATPWSWSFAPTNGTGYYQVYSIATDVAGNIESAPGSADRILVYDAVAPTSSVDAFPSFNITSVPLTVDVTASDDMWVKDVSLYTRNSTDNSTWGAYTLYGTDTTSPYSFSFTPSTIGQQNGKYYQFYSIATDNSTNSGTGYNQSARFEIPATITHSSPYPVDAAINISTDGVGVNIQRNHSLGYGVSTFLRSNCSGTWTTYADSTGGNPPWYFVTDINGDGWDV